MNKLTVTERQQSDGAEFEVLDLTKTMTSSLDKLRLYLQNSTEKISADAREKSMSELTQLVQEGMEQRDIDVMTNTSKEWTKDDLLDLLFELEYQRFMDIKLHTSDVFHRIILPHLQKKELNDGVNYIVSYGDVASVIDVKTLSHIHYLYTDNGITGGKLKVENTDIAYFNSDITKDGEPKVITPRHAIEVTPTCISDIIEELTGDDGTTLNRHRRRMLKYHRAKLVINELTLGGKPIRPASDEATPAIKQLAAGLYLNRLSPKGHKYYIALKNIDLSWIVNTAIWETYYSLQTSVQKNIPHMINEGFPENKIVLYSLGESVDSTFLIKLNKNQSHTDREEAKRVLNCHSVCAGMVETNSLEKKEISLTLNLVAGRQFKEIEGIKVEYGQLFAHHPKDLVSSRTTDQLILPQSAHNNQKLFMPAEHSWDLVHPSRSNYILGKRMAEEGLPIHWYDL